MKIEIRGASEHNLQGIDVEFGDGLTVVTGVSGSGKTSLVFDTLYHEARRRLLDVLSTSRPGGWSQPAAPARVESISGLGPAIAVGQNVLNRNPLSTLASASGLHPFLRLLYTRFGTRRCTQCGTLLEVLSEDELVGRLLSVAAREPVQVSAPLLHGVVGSHRTLLELLAGRFGPEALRVDGRSWQGEPLAPGQAHDLEVELGRLDLSRRSPGPVAGARECVQQAAALGAQAIIARAAEIELRLASAPVCPGCGTWFGQLEPKHFHLPCPSCDGRGCPRCDGTGTHPLGAAVRWQGLRLPELLARPVDEVRGLFTAWDLPAAAQRLHQEIERRLDALDRVGLGYLTLDRPAPTLSRGESQRVRLAVALTSRLEDMLYVLDEPTIGQHPADVVRFLPALRELAGPVVYVEHDRVAAAAADHAVDLGPGAGAEGGQVVFAGSPAGLWQADTPTGRHFSRRSSVPAPQARPLPEQFVTLRRARQHNLQDIDVAIPTGRLTVITGVSGSGKSTLVEHVLVPSVEAGAAVGCRAVEGPALKAVLVDQSPIGHNPRSNPATYTKLSDAIRDLYARATGLSASHFSFNRPEGACPACQGMGAVEVKMQFLHPLWIPCADCDGQRFSDEVLAARVPFGARSLSIADVYRLSIREVAGLLAGETRLPAAELATARRIVQALLDVGLGYLPLGQPSPSLSGGEAQRVKLTKYLGRGRLADRLLVLDEPSTGLHPQDLAGLLMVLDRLVRAGATIVVVEHNTDMIRAADWIVDLGPGAGPAGGRVVYAGPASGLAQAEGSATAAALRQELLLEPRATERASSTRAQSIEIRNARANNLQGIDVSIPKGKLTVVTGLSGSGKSSLVGDVLEAEARRRYLESLSMYERQGQREGPEAPVDSVSGLGVVLTVRGVQAHLWSALTHFTRRATVGRASELSHYLAVLLANLGERHCPECGAAMARRGEWECPVCGARAAIAQPRHFSTAAYASACEQCTGLGVLFTPRPEKLLIHPERPLCAEAMYSPGYWPQSYLCQDTGICQALGLRYGYDPLTTPWNEMSEEAQSAFLFGDPEPLERTYVSKSSGRTVQVRQPWEGFYGGWVREWDVHGTYTQSEACPRCGGSGLKDEFLAVKLAGRTSHDLREMPLEALEEVLDGLRSTAPVPGSPLGAERTALEPALEAAQRRVRFLRKVGLGYLHLNRPLGTLSAGEAQRIQVASLLGSRLTSLTVLLDEPSRGMHPSELQALRRALHELRDEGNTVIVVEHDPLLIRAADHIVDVGPGAGTSGGRVVASGTPAEVAQADTETGKWLRGEGQVALGGCREPAGWLKVVGATANNLQGETVHIPLGVLTGICGVSGSGKSTLIVDTLGRALMHRAHSTSFARQPAEPGAHQAIMGAPPRTVVVDQARQGIHNPAAFLGLAKPLLKLYADSEDAQALGLDERQLGRPCSACRGRGAQQIDMGFLPDLSVECETCRGTGYLPEAWDVRVRGLALPEVNALTLDEVYERFADQEAIARPVQAARAVGLGYLVWRQPGYALSGGEAQRLKIARELGRRAPAETLYILDEPTLGQHLADVARLVVVLGRLVAAGHSVVVIEHSPLLLAACDWLIELGPGGGPHGGKVVAAGPPGEVAQGDTPTAPYVREALEAAQ